MRFLLSAAVFAALVAGMACGDDDNSSTNDPGGNATGAARPGGQQATIPATSGQPAVSLPVDSDGNAPGIPPLTGDIVTTASGLKYIDQAVGDGAVAVASSAVTVHYTGWMTDGKKFDSSVDRGTPATFMLSGVIKGWTEGVAGMEIGGKRRLIIPGSLAYGPAGNARAGIPGNATLIFDIELLAVQ